MPSVETAGLTDRVVLFRFQYWDGYGEMVVSATPDQIPVRWEKTRREAKDAKGGTVEITVDLFVDRPVLVGSIIWHGCKRDWAGASTNPGTQLFRVMDYDEVPDIKGINVQRCCGLALFRAPPLPTGPS